MSLDSVNFYKIYLQSTLSTNFTTKPILPFNHWYESFFFLQEYTIRFSCSKLIQQILNITVKDNIIHKNIHVNLALPWPE